jgi:S-adenosylmethionine synthetase
MTHDRFREVTRAAIKDIGYEQRGFHWKDAEIDGRTSTPVADIARASTPPATRTRAPATRASCSATPAARPTS